jgi:hypothetical protein
LAASLRPRIKRTIEIAHAGLSRFGTSMSKQHQMHGDSIDFFDGAI